MKRLVGLLIALAALAGPAQALAGVSFTAPSAGSHLHLDQTLTISWVGSSLADANDTHRSTLTFTGVSGTFTMRLTAAGVAAGSLTFVPDTPTATFLAAHPGVVDVTPSLGTVVIQPDTYTVALAIIKSDGTTSATGTVTGIEIQNQCGPGTYSADGWPPCTQAAPGHYVYTAGQTNQLPCLAGTFNGSFGSYTCYDAPPGSYVPEAASLAPTECAVGHYQDLPGQTSCTLAPENTFVAATGALTATPCPSGTTSPAGSTSASACVSPADTTARAESSSATTSTGCVVARGMRVTAACVARQLGISIARPKRSRLTLAPRRQAACAAKRGTVRGVSAGTCSVILLVTAPGAMTKTYRATITISA